MIIKLDEIVDIELKNFLLSLKGITDVEINDDTCFVKLNIKLTEKTNPYIVMKFIELFQKK